MSVLVICQIFFPFFFLFSWSYSIYSFWFWFIFTQQLKKLVTEKDIKETADINKKWLAERDWFNTKSGYLSLLGFPPSLFQVLSFSSFVHSPFPFSLSPWMSSSFLCHSSMLVFQFPLRVRYLPCACPLSPLPILFSLSLLPPSLSLSLSLPLFLSLSPSLPPSLCLSCQCDLMKNSWEKYMHQYFSDWLRYVSRKTTKKSGSRKRQQTTLRQIQEPLIHNTTFHSCFYPNHILASIQFTNSVPS